MNCTIFHISDLHLGPPFDPERGRLILEEVHRYKPTLTVISGDLVQRADFRDQWLQAKAFIEQIPEPRLIVPGNHDVPAYNPIARFFWPLRNYKKYITPNLTPIFEFGDVVVVGINTARSFARDGGKIGERQLAELEATLSRYPDHYCKIVVMHHHIAPPPGETRRAIPNARQVRRTLDRAGVELVLCGHTHASYIGNTLEFDPLLKAGTVIVQAGTATSRRGRRWYRGKNAYFIIQVERERLVITENLYLPNAAGFVPVSQHLFPRRSAGVYALPAHEQVAVEVNHQTADDWAMERSGEAGPPTP